MNRIKLESLKVQSFVTDFKVDESQKIKGGSLSNCTWKPASPRQPIPESIIACSGGDACTAGIPLRGFAGVVQCLIRGRD